MTLKDISNGPDWVIWIAFAVILVISIILLSGHGANLIAGYNTARKEEKEKFNEKKLCRITGTGMLIVAVMILVMALGDNALPAETAYVFTGITIADCAIVIILANTICRK